jgi:lipid-binding SYLF domain-containing protein
MTRSIRSLAIALVVAVTTAAPITTAFAASAAELDRDSKAALADLYAKEQAAQRLGEKAKAILVFPGIVKAGFMFGGQLGEGALLRNGKTAAYYNSIAASYGMQAGIQKFGYALFFMNDDAVSYLDSSKGFEVGVGPSVVVVDSGMGSALTTTTMKDDVYAFIFDQKGLMAGLGVQGSKITKLDK